MTRASTEAPASVTVDGLVCVGRLALIVALVVGNRDWLALDTTEHGRLEIAWADGSMSLRVQHARHGFREPG